MDHPLSEAVDLTATALRPSPARQPDWLPMEYVLPLRVATPLRAAFAAYLSFLTDHLEVSVIDGSPAPVRAVHRARWPVAVRQIPVQPELGRPVNGKVLGVVTGLQLARHDKVVIADDDVRYDLDGLHRMAGLLDRAEVVRPQNYSQPLPWHARWDTARTLINRAFGADYPGTLGVRRSALPDGYRDDILFENLELIRTVIARGGREHRANDLFVRRIPPTPRHFWSQRLRQAYDSQAQPLRLALELGLLPALVAQRRRPVGYLGWLLGCYGLAAVGRARHHGSRVYRGTAPLWAPVWVAERAITSWLAVALRLGGGMPYAGRRLRSAATPLRELRRLAPCPSDTHSGPRDATPHGD